MLNGSAWSDATASRWEQAIPMRSRQEEREDRKETQKESRIMRVCMLHGSTWSTERKCMRSTKIPLTSFSELNTE